MRLVDLRRCVALQHPVQGGQQRVMLGPRADGDADAVGQARRVGEVADQHAVVEQAVEQRVVRCAHQYEVGL